MRQRNIFEFIAAGADPRAADGILFPTFREGLRAAVVANALVESAKAGGQWTAVAPQPEPA